MIVHNLTDQSPPHRPTRKPKDFKYVGRVIKPGESGEIPDHLLDLADIAGWITSLSVSIDGTPNWYRIAKEKQLGAELLSSKQTDPGPDSEPAEIIDGEEAE